MSTEEKWDEYLELVRRYLATGRFDRDEIDYKIEIARKLERSRGALLADDDEWLDLLRQALSGKAHPVDWRDADHLRKWLNRDRDAGREALWTVWSDGDLKPGAIPRVLGAVSCRRGAGGSGHPPEDHLGTAHGSRSGSLSTVRGEGLRPVIPPAQLQRSAEGR